MSKNGIKYEQHVNIPIILGAGNEVKFGRHATDVYYVYDNVEIKYKILEQGAFKRYMRQYLTPQERNLIPDCAVLDEENKRLFIFEKKFQTCKGSCDEKIQTGLFKKWFYERQFINFKITYVYILNNWFKKKKYKPEMKYLELNKIPVLFSEDENFKNDLIKLLK